MFLSVAYARACRKATPHKVLDEWYSIRERKKTADLYYHSWRRAARLPQKTISLDTWHIDSDCLAFVAADLFPSR